MSNDKREAALEVWKRIGKGEWQHPDARLSPIILMMASNGFKPSKIAARSPNCPPEILVEVLKRGKNDWVSQNAAWNENCPPEILAEVLRRGKNDKVSQFAAENPNCPPKEKIKWN